MKKSVSFGLAALGLLLGANSGFSQIPDSIFSPTDTSFRDMWNRRDLNSDFWARSTNWSVLYPGTDSAIIRTDGLALNGTTGWTNLVWKWQATPAQANMELRFSWHMTSTPSGNSGFNLRGRCNTGTIANFCGGLSAGFRVYGPQIDLGPTYTTDIWNSGSGRYATGNSSCKLTSTVWQDLGYRISNDTAYMLYYRNGFAAGSPTVCAQYFFTVASDKAATSPGIIALQYETQEVSEFRNIKIKNLDAVPTTGVKRTGQSGILPTVEGRPGSIAYSIPGFGRYSVHVSDLSGKVVKILQGTGPVTRQGVSLGASGLFVVKLSSSQGGTTRKVYVH